jgi:glycosyltransferase involved in cell wall biosynthesis
LRYAALILTLNEALHIEACLRSLADATSIVVVDSGSTDGTLAVVRDRFPDAVVVTRPFTSFSDQRNYGLRHCFRGEDWVLHLDADERVGAGLAEELQRLEPPPTAIAYNLAPLTFLYGRPVPRASGYPVYQTRLTRAGEFEFEEVGHGQKAARRLGTFPSLREPYLHYPFEKGWEEWEARHKRYASREAAAFLTGAPASPWAGLQDPIARRSCLRRTTLRLPLRPWLVWAYLMFVRGGVLEGSAGREYCRRRRLYEAMVGTAVAARTTS